MAEAEEGIDIVVVGYRPGPETDRLLADVRDLTTGPSQLHYVDNTGNPRTLSAAWNDLARVGTHPFIAFLNSDAVPCPGWNRLLTEVLVSHPDAGVAIPMAVGKNPTYLERAFTVGQPPDRRDMIMMADWAREKAAGTPILYDYGSECAPFFSVALRRSEFEELKGFDERLRFYGQDHDLQDRLRAMGKKILRVVTCPFYHADSVATKKAIEKGDIDIMEEYRHIGRILAPLRTGTMPRWHLLSDQERAAVRNDPKYRMSGRR